ncbi:MAG: hypothetical protein ACREJC_05250 [Tepidisphaeraceae bacterium]
MKKIALLVLSAAGVTGCARPGEIGYTPTLTADQRGQQIARNWDYEGKQAVDDWDHFWLSRPASSLTIWNVRTPY